MTKIGQRAGIPGALLAGAWSIAGAGAGAGGVGPVDRLLRDGFEPPFVYLLDDGAGNVNIGPPSSFDPDMLWGNYFLVAPGAEVVTAIEVAFGATFPSLASGPVTFWLLVDADADGDPRNATAVASVQATPDVSGNAFYRVAIAPTRVQGRSSSVPAPACWAGRTGLPGSTPTRRPTGPGSSTRRTSPR